MIFFCYFHNKNGIDFGCDPIWPRFCSSMISKEQFLTVLPYFFSELQYYNIIYKDYINFLTYLNRNQQKRSKVGETKRYNLTKFYHKQSTAYLISPCLRKIEWWISRFITKPSNQVTQFLQASSMWKSDGGFFSNIFIYMGYRCTLI